MPSAVSHVARQSRQPADHQRYAVASFGEKVSLSEFAGFNPNIRSRNVMGFYTQLIFNQIEVPRDCLRPMRDSARKMLVVANCRWSYMLNYIYVESSDGDIIDLQISKEMKKELKKSHGNHPVPLDKLGHRKEHIESEVDPDDPWYMLAWDPCDIGDSGKWYAADGFVTWISEFCTAGQLYQVTQEGGGGLWGWEFNEGKFRELELKSKGRWRKSPQSKTA